MPVKPFFGTKQAAIGHSTSTTTDWFQRKFGKPILQQFGNNTNDSETDNKCKAKKHEDLKRELRQRLAIRRQEDLERRYNFYNAENEIFEEPEDDEEEGAVAAIDGEDTDEDKEGEETEENGDQLEEDNEMLENSLVEDGDEENGMEDEFKEEEEIDGGDNDDEEHSEGEGADNEGRNISTRMEDDSVGEDDNEDKLCAVKYANDYFTPRGIISDDDGDEEGQDATMGSAAGRPQMNTQDCMEEALLLCSGQFGDGINNSEDLFTVEDEVADNEAENDGDEGEDGEEEKESIEQDEEENTKDGHRIRREDVEQDEKEEDWDDKPIGIRKGFSIQTEQTNKKVSNLFDDEASLSGDDVGSDPEDDQADGLDEYEAEEGDQDDLPDETEIRDNLVRQYLKHRKDVDDRQLLKLQEAFFVDSDLHGQGVSMDRSFRLRMHDDSKVDWAKLLGAAEDGEANEADDEQEEMEAKAAEERVEMLKCQLEQEKLERRKRRANARRKRADGNENNAGDNAEEHCLDVDEADSDEDFDEADEQDNVDFVAEFGKQSTLFSFGEQILANNEKSADIRAADLHSSSSSSSNRISLSTFSPSSSSSLYPIAVQQRNSLLAKADRLEQLVKDDKLLRGPPAVQTLFTVQQANRRF